MLCTETKLIPATITPTSRSRPIDEIKMKSLESEQYDSKLTVIYLENIALPLDEDLNDPMEIAKLDLSQFVIVVCEV